MKFRDLFGCFLLVVGGGILTGGLSMVRPPLPDRPAVSESPFRRDDEAVTKARTALYEAEVANYRRLQAEDAAMQSARPLYEKVWPAYIVAGSLLAIFGFVLLFK